MEVEAIVTHWVYLIYRSVTSRISWSTFLELTKYVNLMQELTEYSVSSTCSTEWTYSFIFMEKR